MELKLGVMPVLKGAGAADPAATARFVRLLEDLGCESVWAVEHVVVPDDYTSPYPYDTSGRMSLGADDDIPDPLHWLTFAAAHTSTLRLGTAMLILPEHHPVDLAKRLATVDVLSGGRLLAGVGVGWLREEYAAVGVPFEERGARADEYLAAMHALWTGSPATFHGRFVSFDAVHSKPRPVNGTVPIHVGGHSRAAVRRAARFGAGWYPLGVHGDAFTTLLDQLRAECRAVGRDPAEVEITMRAPGSRAELETLRSQGVARVVIRADADDPVGVRDKVRRYQREVMKA
ncbi:LLM class F420-dependent oxidoreductase [Dactylosporangium fulvum]|uniref:LLM class F420-dependent oxidoreductase n=1 Tax=Dactylosporangium fulvum TaxID=53359 RepID=A0ABY5VMK9_9ACTN|nr:LLM class F420-dependent oxidoreductase [Dactylosporangium fulvum]UWP78625.1 LLM class F420-dependent oxidoreductase [Dactylosporangium fulvum]